MRLHKAYIPHPATPFTGIKKRKTFYQQKVAEKSEKQLKGEQQLRQQAGIK